MTGNVVSTAACMSSLCLSPVLSSVIITALTSLCMLYTPHFISECVICILYYTYLLLLFKILAYLVNSVSEVTTIRHCINSIIIIIVVIITRYLRQKNVAKVEMNCSCVGGCVCVCVCD